MNKQVCEAGSTLAQRRVVLCDVVHVSRVFKMKYLYYLSHILFIYMIMYFNAFLGSYKLLPKNILESLF